MIKAIRGNNFSGRTFYLKCLTRYPSNEVREVISDIEKIERDNRNSIYIHPIPEKNFTGIFDTVYDELFQLRPQNEISEFTQRIINKLGLKELYTQNPFTLSGGEKAILAILSSAIMEPKSLGIDTTLEQLDSTNKELVLAYFGNLSIPETIFSDNRLEELNGDFYLVDEYKELKETINDEYTFSKINSNAFPCIENNVVELDINNLSFSYGNKQIFKNLSLLFKSGNIYHLSGKNGSGKSTLSKILSGVLKPQNNSKIILNNKLIKPYKEPGKHVGYCFQQPDEQLFSSTVASELQFESLKNSFVKSISKAFGLQNVLNIHPFDLPTTIRKRLSIAATLVVDRPIYIIDEPTLFLDDENVSELAEIVAKLSSKGKIVILISHSKAFISKFENIRTIQL